MTPSGAGGLISQASGATLTYSVTVKAAPGPVPATWIKATSLSTVPDPKLTTNVAVSSIRVS